MTLPRAEGEREALIIPFPLHRVRQVESVDDQHNATLNQDARVIDMDAPRGTDDVPEEHVSADISVEEAIEAVAASPRQQRRARNVSLHALAARGQSRWEIESRLRSRELSPEVIADELDVLERSGLIDDEALAAELVDKYAIRGGLGRRAVMDKLRGRKIPDHFIEQALLVLNPEDESQALRELAESKLRSMGSLDRAVAKRRLGALLLRKGYSPSEVYPLVSELLN